MVVEGGVMDTYAGYVLVEHSMVGDTTSEDCLGSGITPPATAHNRVGAFNTWVVCPMCLQYRQIVKRPTIVERRRSL
jgi:hypothetical protein